MSNQIGVVRCEKTNNPCETDTYVSGYFCQCRNCIESLVDEQERLGSDFSEVLNDNLFNLYQAE